MPLSQQACFLSLVWEIFAWQSSGMFRKLKIPVRKDPRRGVDVLRDNDKFGSSESVASRPTPPNWFYLQHATISGQGRTLGRKSHYHREVAEHPQCQKKRANVYYVTGRILSSLQKGQCRQPLRLLLDWELGPSLDF